MISTELPAFRPQPGAGRCYRFRGAHPNNVRNNIWGGTLGNRIIRNKLFTFTAYEQWRFTHHLRSSDNHVFWRNSECTPFEGNVIPQSRMDPTALRFMRNIWLPNGPGDDATNVNNYTTEYTGSLKYLNISSRTDWNINEQWNRQR